MPFDFASPSEYFSELARQAASEHAPAGFRLNVVDEKTQTVMRLFKMNGIQVTLSQEQEGVSCIHITREKLVDWLQSQRALAATFSIDVPTLIKVVNSGQLDENEKRQVAVALRALNETAYANVKELAKREDLHQIEAFFLRGAYQCANALSPDVQKSCDAVAKNIFQARRDRVSNQEQLFRVVADISTPKSVILALLQKGVDISATNAARATLLMMAAGTGHVEAVEALIAHGAKVDQMNANKSTALHFAANENQPAVMKVLLDNGARVNHQDKWGATALHQATAKDSKKAIELLVSYKADVNLANRFGNTPLHYAARTGKCRALEALIALGASVNQADKQGETPLHIASHYELDPFFPNSNHLGAIKSLLAHGANADLANQDGYRALQLVMRAGEWQAVSCLIDRDSHVSKSIPLVWRCITEDRIQDLPDLMHMKDLDEVDQFIRTIEATSNLPEEIKAPFDEVKSRIASAQAERQANTAWVFKEIGKYQPDISAIKATMSKGINVAQVSLVSNKTLLYACAQANQKDLVGLLIAAGADINQKLPGGATALSEAISWSYPHTVAILLDHGANANQELETGLTSLMLATSRGHPDKVKLLLEKGAHINTVTKKGTALHYAASRGHVELVKLLLLQGASIIPTNESGQNALHLAAENGNTRVIQALMEAGANALQADSQGDTPLNDILNTFTDDSNNTIKYLVDKGYGEVLVRSMLQRGARPENIESLLQRIPNINPQELLGDIDYNAIYGLLASARRDERARRFLTQLVQASLGLQWTGSEVQADEVQRRLQEQYFIFRPSDHSNMFLLQRAGQADLQIPNDDFFHIWAVAAGNPVAMQRALFSLQDPGAYRFEIARSGIDDNPQQILKSLCDKFDEAVCNRLEIRFTGEVGQDVGGLGRQFVSHLFFALSRQLQFARLENGLYRPVLRENSEGDFPLLSDSEQAAYRNMGKLIMFCLHAEVSYPIGMLFDQGVFVALTHPEVFGSIDFANTQVFDRMFQIYKNMNRFIEDDVKSVQRMERSLKPQNDKEWNEAEQTALLNPEFLKLEKEGKWANTVARQASIHAAVRKYVMEVKLKPALAPLFEIAVGMQAAPFGQIPHIPPAEFSRRLQGTVSKQEILNKLRFASVPNEIQAWFRAWIAQADSKKIEDLIFALSGSSAIGNDAEIHIQEEGQFIFHTCFNTFGLKCAAIRSEEDLKKNLAWALEYARAQGGFDLA